MKSYIRSRINMLLILLIGCTQLGFSQTTQLKVPGPDSVIVYLSLSEYSMVQAHRLESPGLQSISPNYNFTDIVSLINRVLGITQGMTSPKSYSQKTAVQAMKIQRKELIALLKDFNKEKITLHDYQNMVDKHHGIDFTPQ